MTADIPACLFNRNIRISGSKLSIANIFIVAKELLHERMYNLLKLPSRYVVAMAKFIRFLKPQKQIHTQHALHE